MRIFSAPQQLHAQKEPIPKQLQFPFTALPLIPSTKFLTPFGPIKKMLYSGTFSVYSMGITTKFMGTSLLL